MPNLDDEDENEINQKAMQEIISKKINAKVTKILGYDWRSILLQVINLVCVIFIAVICFLYRNRIGVITT